MVVRLATLIAGGIEAGVKGVVAADRALSLLPPYRRGRGLVLDTLLGPAEDFEYVSTTAPRKPPPTY